MNALDHFLAARGNWQGTSTLQDPTTGSPDQGPATASITALLGNKFVRMDYTWQYQGNAHEGSLLIGYETEAATVTAQWIDSWHVGDKVMACRGTVDEQGVYSVLGSYSVPGWPDWGWRILLDPTATATLRVVMYNVSPDGQEYLAVETDLQRV